MLKSNIFLDNLPKWKDGTNKGRINWEKSIGYNVNFQYDDIKSTLKIINYFKNEKNNPYLKIEFNNKIIDISIGNFRNCMLGNLLGKVTNDFKVEIGQTFKDTKRNITIIDREYRDKPRKDGYVQKFKWYKYKCGKCGWNEGWIEENNLFQGNGCGCCNGKVVIEGINDIPTTAPWMIKYFQGGYDEAKLYTYGSKQKICPICPDCGKVKDKAISIYNIYNDHSIGCPYCSDGISYPEKLMINIFEQLNIQTEYQYQPNWIKPKRFDFYFELNNKKYIIETDGGWHSQDNKLSGQTVEESQQIDDEKDKLADEHGIEVIRIDCNESELEYIKNDILIKLSNLFDLSNLDWNKVEEFALSNLVKKACELKRDNPNFTTTQIGKIMNLHQVTIIRYLKKGSKIWSWVDYNSKEENTKSAINANKLKRKPIGIFKNGIKLDEFESCNELSRVSEEKFGVNLLSSNISLVCLGKQKHHKGFTFKYIEQTQL